MYADGTQDLITLLFMKRFVQLAEPDICPEIEIRRINSVISVCSETVVLIDLEAEVSGDKH